MRESIGSIFLYNVIIIFLVIIFGFAGALITYMKAYKVNSRIVNEIEKYEGYNEEAELQINGILGTLGYRVNDGKNCPARSDGTLLTNNANRPNFRYCVYQTKSATQANPYDQYMVVTYIFIDLPFVDEFAFPVKSKTTEIFRFGIGGNP